MVVADVGPAGGSEPEGRKFLNNDQYSGAKLLWDTSQIEQANSRPVVGDKTSAIKRRDI